MLFIYTIIYFIVALLYFSKLNIIASCLGILLAIFLYVTEIKKTGRFVNARGLFGISFIGAFSLSILKLSNNSLDFFKMTMLVIFLSYFSLFVGTFVYTKMKKCDEVFVYENITKKSCIWNRQNILVILLIIITFCSFLCEAFILGFVPFFTKDTPHAYSTFHIFGLHYITTFAAFIPGIAICNYMVNKKSLIEKGLILISFLYVIILSILMVSRSILIKSAILSVIIILIYQNKNILNILCGKEIIKHKPKIIFTFIAIFLIFIILYVGITILRAHNIAYLNEIFDMKINLPIFISQPYIYLTSGYENLNYMIENLFRSTCGRRMLLPLWTLTLIKKFFPIIADSPTYILKTELSTLTLVYDAYYDFGLCGIIIFCFGLGYIGKMLEDNCYKNILFGNIKKNNYIVLLFALFSYYMTLSFFQTFFSLTDTWVNIIFILILIVFFRQDKEINEIVINEENL